MVSSHTKGSAVHRTPEPMTDTDRTHHECVDCGATIPVDEGPPDEFLEAARGKPSRRVVTIAGTEVHRCQSVFLIGTG
jgi:hypothetical protein